MMSDQSSHDARRADDATARRIAQTVFDRPLVIEAGAGTGKTATLVARIVAWCTGPGWIKAAAALADSAPGGSTIELERIAARVLERVVAITFTEAAAAEMATRVGEALAAIERAESPTGVLLEALPAAADERRLRARALLAALDRLVVRTIHAFCRRLLATYPFEAGLHPNFDVDADGTVQADVLRAVLETTLASAYADPSDPLLALAEKGFGPTQLEEALTVLVNAGVPASALADDPFSAARVTAARESFVGLLAAFDHADGGCLAGASRSRTTGEVLDCIARTLPLMQDGHAEFEPLLVQLGTIWSETALDRLNKWGKGTFNRTETECLGERCTTVADAAALLARRVAHFLALDPVLTDHARRGLGPLLAEMHRRMRARGAETFAALLRDARDLLREHTEIAARVRQSIDQLLVDEFQDTDRLQCDLVRSIAFEGLPAQRPGVFLVGDPKQSIYGWRNADLRAYDDFVAQVRQHGGAVHELTVNFRSAPAILEEVERLIAPVMRQRVGMQPKFQPLLPCPDRAANTGFAHGRFAPIEFWISRNSEHC